MTQQDGLKKPRVLFICTGDTAHSQTVLALREAQSSSPNVPDARPRPPVWQRVQDEIDLMAREWQAV